MKLTLLGFPHEKVRKGFLMKIRLTKYKSQKKRQNTITRETANA